MYVGRAEVRTMTREGGYSGDDDRDFPYLIFQSLKRYVPKILGTYLHSTCSSPLRVDLVGVLVGWCLCTLHICTVSEYRYSTALLKKLSGLLQ